MKKFFILMFLFMLFSCNKDVKEMTFKQTSWDSRHSNEVDYENLFIGKSYLPVYSHIYPLRKQRPFYLSATISIRNLSPGDEMFLISADYYNTEGDLVRNYLDKPIFIKPLESIAFVMSEEETEGGSGAKFIFEWAVKNDKNPPLFEAIMVSTLGQQGLSFSTRGIQLFD